MDYDDNDFQAQNIHLAGEGSSKFSPVLRPYALPKFEFDDSLQGHLRFDSLVENEVFLGIPSQEDNQWIEDYSRGSSGIEFDSSAAESCSISRHNNVWSEATSSESVEMLLKSVGQEDRVPGETILEESGIGDVLGNLTSQMEPSVKQDDGKDDALHSQNASPSDVYASTGGVLQNLQSGEVELSSSELGSKFGCEPFEEKNDSKHDDVNQVINDNMVNESVAEEMPKHLSISSSQCGNADASSELNAQEFSQQVSDICMENGNNLPEAKWKSVEEQGVMGTEVNMDGQLSSASTVEIRTHNLGSSLCFNSKVESMDSQLVEICISNVEAATSSLLKGGCDSQIAEGCNVGMTSGEPSPACELDAKVSSNCLEINQQPKGNTHLESPLVSVGGETSGVDAIVVDISTTEIPDHSELKMDSLTQIAVAQDDSFQENEDAAGIDGGQYRGALVNSPDTSIISVLGNKESEPCDERSIDQASDTTNLMSYSSEDLLAVRTSMENHEIHEVESNAEGCISPPMLSGSEQIHQENPSSELNDVYMYQDVCVQEAGVAPLSKESSEMVGRLAGAHHWPKKVVSSSSGENTGDIVVAQGSDSHMTTETETAVKETNVESCETLYALQTFSGSNTQTNVVTDPDDQPNSPILGVRLQLLDEKEGMEVDREASPLNGGSQASVVLNPVSEVKEDTSPDCAGQVQHEKGDHCGAVLDNFHMDKGEQAAVSEEIGHECSKDLEASPIPCDSSRKERDEAGAVHPGNAEETKMERNDGVQHPPVESTGKESGCQASVGPSRLSESDINQAVDGGISAGLDKLDCGSPTIISCVEPSHNVKINQEDDKGAMIDVVPISDVTDNVKGNVQSISKDVTDNVVSKGERSFTFEVCPSAGLGDAGKIVEESAAKSGGGQVDPKMSLGITKSSPQTPIVGTAKAGAKGSSERKPRRKSTGKESGKRGNSVKETTTPKPWGRSEKSRVPLVTPGTGQAQQFEELKPYEIVERGAAKPSGVGSIPTSNLPDLNTSVSLFQQPFTDMQQVQLRAQILVYGSLIQGTTPEEACMIAAFGPSDGGKSFWEPAWRASFERLHGRKSQANNSDTPVLSSSGITTPDSAMKHGSAQSKVPSSSTTRANKKGTQPPIISPMIPLSSPLWNISAPSGDGLQAGGIPRGTPLDYHQALSPLHPYQNPPAQNFVGHNPSWLSQGGYTGPWVAAPTSPFNFGARISTLPNTESVKLTPAKESDMPIIKHTPHIPVVYAGGSSAVSGVSSLPELKQAAVPSGQPSGDSKSRKRKKVPVCEPHVQISLPGQTQTVPVHTPVVIDHMSHKIEGPGRIPLLAQNRTESVSIPVVSSIFTAAVAVSTTACFNSRSSPTKLPSAVTPTSSSDHLKTGDQNADDKVIISEETLSKVEEAKLHAEEAAKHAAAAVSRCQGVWSQLEREKISGLVSDVEAKLASAAVSVAAAASVAKAAAAAAKIASNAAEQAKLMADEVLVSSGSGSFSESHIISLSNVANNLGNATPASILKGGDGNNRSSSIIVAAREAARRRVEAASAASKHAENLDAIVKAAELAAEAVSQAGKIVEMGDPLPLSKLVASGPEGYWKTSQSLTSHKLNMGNVEVDSNASARPGSFDMETETLKHGVPAEEVSGIVPESELGVSNTSIVGQKDFHTPGTSEEKIIKEGCLVEVFKDGGKFKAAWFAATVLSLKDGKAYLSYNELQSDEEKLKEWVALEGDGKMVPRIRIAHPMTIMKFEGPRKRRRSAVMDYSWSVGDRVDAWIHNCWCEGIVTEKDKNDETTLTVHFPAQAETLVVRAWHLRPTLIWKDGKWIEWSSSNGARSSEGDTPKEKRPKLGNPAGEDRGKDKLLVGDAPQEKRPKLGISAVEAHGKGRIPTRVDHVAAGSHEEARLLPLSADEKVFNVGKNTMADNKLDSHRTVRSGLQKEGPRVVFGVPKPGKKQKFMDVSKHYNGDRSNKNDAVKNSVNFSRYLMPQGSGPRGWKSISRSDNKDKQPAEIKPRVFKSVKAQYSSSRTLSTKDSASHSVKFAPMDKTMAEVVKDSESNDKESGEHAQKEFRSSSNSEDASDGPMLVSSVAPPAVAPKKATSSNARSERLNKGKLAPAAVKSAKQEVKDKSVPDGAEPRRSNRRIQPTSRLLEGLQSSLTITKIPAAPQDRSHRSRSTSKGK